MPNQGQQLKFAHIKLFANAIFSSLPIYIFEVDLQH